MRCFRVSCARMRTTHTGTHLHQPAHLPLLEHQRRRIKGRRQSKAHGIGAYGQRAQGHETRATRGEDPCDGIRLQGMSHDAARDGTGGDGREGAGQRACSLRCCRAGAFSKLRVHVPSSRLHWRSRCSSGLLEGKMGRFCSELKLTSSHLSSGSSDKESGQWFNIVEGRTVQRFSIKINPAKMLLQRTA